MAPPHEEVDHPASWAGWETMYCGEEGDDITEVQRMRVPGGWVVATTTRYAFSTCFVPDPPKTGGPEDL